MPAICSSPARLPCPFDRLRETRTRLAAVVHEPFRLSDFVPHPAEQAVLFDFVNNYQQRFAGFVREAVALAASPAAT